MLILHKSLTEVLGLFCCHPTGRSRMRADVRARARVCVCVDVRPRCNIHDEFCCNLSVFQEAAKQKQRERESGKSALT